MSAPPYSYPLELASIPQQGTEVRLSADAAERARIATWLGALEVSSLRATVRLARQEDDSYRYEAEFSGEVVQACSVTLDPVPAAHSGAFTRRYRVAPRSARRAVRNVPVEVDPAEDAPEILESSLLDIAAPVLEELSLMLDPYPRAPGVTFEPPKEESDAKDNPFAVLAKLKQPKEGGPEPRK
jgi:uncharacterized metal-binding protein YceD (DUF177 family)